MNFNRSLTTLVCGAFLLTAGQALAGSGNWNVDAGGNWSTGANWLPTGAPGTAAGDSVGLTFDITGNRTITNDTTVTLGILKVGDANNGNTYTLTNNASTSFTFNNSGAGAQLFELVTSKGDTIALPITLADNLVVTNGSTNTLTLSGAIGGAGKSVSIFNTNGGVVLVSGTNTYSGGTTIGSGSVRAGVSSVTSGTSVTSGAFGTGNLTLNNGITLSGAASTRTIIAAPQINLAGNVTVATNTGSLEFDSVVDLGGSSRTITLGHASANFASGSEVCRFNQPSGFGTTIIQNAGTGGYVEFTTATGSAASPSIVRFLYTTTATTFSGNLGLVLDDGVAGSCGSGNFFATGANAPALTLNANVSKGGGILQMGDGVTGTTSNAVVRSAEIYSLSGAGSVSATNFSVATNTLTPATGTLTINNGNGASFGGSISDYPTLGKLNLTKSGAGAQTFTGVNAYNGTTTISGGTLFVNGTNTVSNGALGYYVINSGGTLGGGGLIDLSAVNLGVTNKNGGKISPGATASTAGTLTLSLGTAVLDITSGLGTAGSLVFDIAGTNSSDKIILNSGTLNIGSGLLNWNSFAFNNLGGLQAGTYKLITTPNIISGSLGSSLTGVIGTYNGTLALSGDSKSVILTLAAPSLPIPSFSSLTPSQTIGAGTVSITLTGKVSASGPTYPANGESGTVSATINGTQTFGTFTDGVGDFSINFNPSAIPASVTPYTITYSFAGDGSLSAAANDTSTTLTVTTNIVWTGVVSTNFETGGNWSTASAPANDLTSQLAVFSGSVTANQPALSSSRNVSGLSFTTAAGGWTLSGTANNVLSLGVNGISTTGQTSGSNIISGTLNVATNQTWKVGTGGSLLLTGSITNNNASTNFSLTVNASSSLGNVILSPSAGNSVNLTGSNNTASIFEIKSGGYLELGGDGVTAPATTSTNYINNTQTSSSFGTWGINAPGKVQVNSGTWITGDLGKNGADKFTGSLQVNGGMVEFSGARFLGEGTINVSSGTLAVSCVGSGFNNGGKFSLGSGYNAITNTANMNVTGGFVDLAQANLGNSIGAAISTLLNQSGGNIQNGVTVGGGNNGGTAATFSIGGNNVANDFSALTLAAGTFISAGTINAAGPAGSPGANNFNFMGGTLSAAGVDMTYLGSCSTATSTANQTNSSDNIGTLVNYGGTLAPGGDGTVGRTSITGGYAVSNNAAVLAIDIGGTTEATTFQTNNLGYYDNLVTTTNITLGGSLKISLVPGFTPAGTDQFNIIACSYGGPIITGTFTNLNTTGANGFYLGRVTVAGTTNATFAVTINSLTNTVYLSNYQVASSEATYSTNITATVINGGTTLNLAWPATHLGWTLQAQTNSLATGLSTNWVDIAGTASVTSTNMPIVPANPAVFYRLRY